MVSGPAFNGVLGYKFKIRDMYAFSKQIYKAYIVISWNYLI